MQTFKTVDDTNGSIASGEVVDWMHELAIHYEQLRRAYPGDELCIAFDIDGTILDMRHSSFRRCSPTIGDMTLNTSEDCAMKTSASTRVALNDS